MKKIIQYAVIMISVGVGIYVGHLCQKYLLPNMGANYITPSDIIACYIISLLVFGVIGIYVGAIYLEDKIPNKPKY